MFVVDEAETPATVNGNSACVVHVWESTVALGPSMMARAFDTVLRRFSVNCPKEGLR
jgi:hypothetical protein